MPNHIYPNIMSATTGVLVEVCRILNRINVEYVIVGGWSPYLLVDSPYNHPGTNDVDVLVRDEGALETLSQAARSLLSAGYSPSAKHSFQLLKSLRVEKQMEGENQELVFNVDLLHPKESSTNPEILADLFDLGIKEDEVRDDTRFIKSIALPSSEAIFDGMSQEQSITHITPTGGEETVSFQLMDLLGLLVSKFKSVKSEKRPRDAFDIFLVFADKNSTDFIERSKQHLSNRAAVRRTLGKLKSYVESDAEKFDYNVQKFVQKFTPQSSLSNSPATVVFDGLVNMGV